MVSKLNDMKITRILLTLVVSIFWVAIIILSFLDKGIIYSLIVSVLTGMLFGASLLFVWGETH